MTEIPSPIESATPAPRPPEPLVTMTISLLSSGGVTVTGPLDNLPLMMKMLAGAMNATAERSGRADGSRLVRANPAAMRALNGLVAP